MPVYTVRLTPESVGDLITEIKNYKKWFNERIDSALRVIADDIAEEARKIYNFPEYNSRLRKEIRDKIPSVTVEKLPGKRGYQVIAHGEMVGFLEFGTGAFADSQHPYAEEVTFPVFPGSYSDTIGAGTYMHWVMTHGNDDYYPFNREPRRALYQAVQKIKPQIAARIREEFEHGYTESNL